MFLMVKRVLTAVSPVQVDRDCRFPEPHNSKVVNIFCGQEAYQPIYLGVRIGFRHCFYEGFVDLIDSKNLSKS